MKYFSLIIASLVILTSCVSSRKAEQAQKQLEIYQQAATKLEKDSTMLADQADGLINMLGSQENKAAQISLEDKYILKLIEDEKQKLNNLENDLNLVFQGLPTEKVFVYHQKGKVRISLDNTFLFDKNLQITSEGENALLVIAEFIKSEQGLEVSVQGLTEVRSFHKEANSQESIQSASIIAKKLVNDGLVKGVQIKTVAQTENNLMPVEVILSYNRNELIAALGNSNTIPVVSNK